jgi:hypothetical protein
MICQACEWEMGKVNGVDNSGLCTPCWLDDVWRVFGTVKICKDCHFERPTNKDGICFTCTVAKKENA